MVTVDVFLDGFFGLLAAAWRSGRGPRSPWRDPHAWAEANPSLWTWLAGIGLLLPLVPVGIATVHFAAFAWRISDDDLMFVLGIILFLPMAMLALVAACILASWAITTAFWLVTGRPHARLFAAGYLLVLAFTAWPMLSVGLSGYGWALLGTTAAATLLVLADLAYAADTAD